MRWIADADKRLIENAIIEMEDGFLDIAARLLRDVLTNMERLAVEKPHPEPFIAPISEAELRVMYPERFAHVD